MSESSSTSTSKSRRGGALREILIVVIVALTLTTIVRTFVVQAFFIPSVSMRPLLQVDDRILVAKYVGDNVVRGDVVVFEDPGGWLPPAAEESGPRAWLRIGLRTVGLLPWDSGEHLVKRVIGVGGDEVTCCDPKGRIEVNGVALTEPYIRGQTDQVRFDVTVPDGHIFVMGDNRGESEDSRFHLDNNSGAVPLASVTGPVNSIVWPPSRWQTIGSPDTFANVAAPKHS